MKIVEKTAVMALILILASCANRDEDSPLVESDVEAVFYADILQQGGFSPTAQASETHRTGAVSPGQGRSSSPNTQASETRSPGTSWHAQDKIGVYAFTGSSLNEGAYGNHKNVPYITSQGNGVFTATSGTRPIIFPNNGSSLNFAAYYPYAAAVDAQYSIALDVSKQQPLQDIDLMYATAEGHNKGNPQVNLGFQHKLSQLVMHVTPEEETISLTNVSVTYANIYPESDFNVATGAVSALDMNQSTVTVTPEVTINAAGTSASATAILLPGQPRDIIEVKIVLNDGTRYTWKPGETAPMQGGYRYSYQLQLGTDGRVRANLTNSTIEPWGAGQNEVTWLSPEKKDPVVSHAGYMEIPVISDGTENPNSHRVTHMITNRSWLNNSNGTFPVRNYTIQFDTNDRYPVWVAYPLHPSYMTSGNRTNDWQYDPLIPSEYQPLLSSGWSNDTYSRGHMLPSASRSATRNLNRTTFYYTNMAAQNTRMNNGVWNELEQKVRVWVEQTGYDTLYVVTGSILPAPPKSVQYTYDNLNKRSAVPEYLYKALLRKQTSTGNFFSIAFKMENRDTGVKYANSVVSVKSLERETGYTFFRMLPPEVAESVKQQTNINQWN